MSPKALEYLKILVVVMAVMIFILGTVLVGTLAIRLFGSGAEEAATTAGALPRSLDPALDNPLDPDALADFYDVELPVGPGATILSVAVDGGRVILHANHPMEGGQVIVLDQATGALIGVMSVPR